jgi:putative acetyltransferase
VTHSASSRASIVKESLETRVAQELIFSLNNELSERYPEPGATHFQLAAEEVADGRGAFLVAYLDSRAVACGALRTIEPGLGEIKRMFVRPTARGRGIGRAVLDALEAEARQLGLRRLVLETGSRQAEALALYQRAGYSRIPAFGDYLDSPLSVCMAKDL